MTIMYYPRNNYYIGLSTDNLSSINQEGAKIYLVDTKTTKINHAGEWYECDNATILGKVGIDQTTDGTTNRVVSKISQTTGENTVTIASGQKVGLQVGGVDVSSSNPLPTTLVGSLPNITIQDVTPTDGKIPVSARTIGVPIVASGKKTDADSTDRTIVTTGFNKISIINDGPAELILAVDQSSLTGTKLIYVRDSEGYEQDIAGTVLHYSIVNDSCTFRYVLT